ncbi:MAG: HigA family addiction module antidote protein [Flavobacteriaceae bacterium]|jgi:addiction module HigA family antidote|nr:HigA family addiction module antidote protein [Flavobacteriaceae bacterium]
MNTERKLQRTHPGLILKSELVDYLGLSITHIAELLEMTRSNVSNLFNGKIALTSNMALRIEQVFGGSAEHLMKMQTVYNLDRERKKVSQIRLKKYHVIK